MGKAFEKIVIVMLENATSQDVLNNAYMSRLRQQGVYLANSYGVTHSSQPNYIAAVAGDTMGFANDTPGYAQFVYSSYQPVTCVADLLDAQGLSWRNYVEDLPATYLAECVADLKAGGGSFPVEPFPFARKHAPFLSFQQVINAPNLSSQIVDASQFATDLAAGNLPNYTWYTPNLINDGHTLADQTANDPLDHKPNIINIQKFLETFLGPDPIATFPPSTLIVITFDEAYPYQDPYQVYTLLIGDMLGAWKGETRFEAYNHYSLLRTVEENFGLASLKRNDIVANPYWFLQGK